MMRSWYYLTWFLLRALGASRVSNEGNPVFEASSMALLAHGPSHDVSYPACVTIVSEARTDVALAFAIHL